jgi:hypothetical protein
MESKNFLTADDTDPKSEGRIPRNPKGADGSQKCPRGAKRECGMAKRRLIGAPGIARLGLNLDLVGFIGDFEGGISTTNAHQ